MLMSYEATKTHILDQPKSFHLPQPKELKMLKMRFLIVAREDFNRTYSDSQVEPSFLFLPSPILMEELSAELLNLTLGNISGKGHN